MKKLTLLLIAAVALLACNSNKTDTINKTSKIDSGRNDAPNKKIYLRGDSANLDTSFKDSIGKN